MKILIGTLENAKEVVKICSLCKEDVLIHSGRYIVDAKSILGVLSLDLSVPAEVESKCSDIFVKLQALNISVD